MVKQCVYQAWTGLQEHGLGLTHSSMIPHTSYIEIGEKQKSREQDKSGRFNSGIRVPETHDHIKVPMSQWL